MIYNRALKNNYVNVVLELPNFTNELSTKLFQCMSKCANWIYCNIYIYINFFKIWPTKINTRKPFKYKSWFQCQLHIHVKGKKRNKWHTFGAWVYKHDICIHFERLRREKWPEYVNVSVNIYSINQALNIHWF